MARLELLPVLIFNDATRFHVGKGERFRQITALTGPLDDFLVHFSIKIDDAPVWPDGSGADVVYVGIFLQKSNGGIGLRFDARFRKNLDPDVLFVDVAINDGALGVHMAAAIENHGVRARAGGIVLQCEIFWRYRQPVVASRNGFGE